MQSYEYKIVKVPMKGFINKEFSPDLDTVLNAEGRSGWKLVNSIVTAKGFGETDRVILVFMR